MKDKEMIEEMAKEIARILFEDCLLNIGGRCADCEWNGKDTKEYDCQSLLVAKKLLEKYQPKLPEGALVISREEKQKLLKGMYEQGKFGVLADLEKDGKVVLSREEYSDYLILQKNHEFIREKAKELQADNERLYKNISKFKEIVSEVE